MDLKEMIYRRKSVRSYTGEPVDEATLQNIKTFIKGIKPLDPKIRVRAEIANKESIKCFLPWTTPQVITVFSEEKDGALENVGFIFQQLDLYLQSIGLGVCWLGMGRLSKQGSIEAKSTDDLNYVIMLAFGYPKGEAQRKDIQEFKRKSLEEISDKKDERLEPARMAPSSVNSQPWYFSHEGDKIHTYCVSKGFLKNGMLSDMNRIDMGIALAHMYVSNPETFHFFREEHGKIKKGYVYIGSFTL